MKILFTHELFPPDVAGGGEIAVYEIVKRLKERGIQIKVLTTGNPKIKKYDNITTIRLPINRYFMNLAFYSIYKHSKDVDIIHTNNYNACLPSYIAAKLNKKPVICHIHEVFNEKWLQMRGFIGGNLSRLVERLQVNHDFDKFIFFSQHMRNTAVDIGVPRKRTETISPGIDFKKFKMKKKEPFVLFVGNMIKRKGLDNLIEVAKKLEDVDFVLVGRGKEKDRLQSIAPKNVKFLGYVSEKKLIDLYSRAMVFCLPSIGEGFGLVLLEAMASGCSIVSTIPLDYEGIKIRINNNEELKNAIESLIKNPKKAKVMGRRNRKIAREYNWKKFISRLIKIYEDVLDEI
jgi:glycosyltransferase involved in cell wall biosynthesis